MCEPEHFNFVEWVTDVLERLERRITPASVPSEEKAFIARTLPDLEEDAVE